MRFLERAQSRVLKSEKALAEALAAAEQAKLNLATQQEEVKIVEERIETLKAAVAGGAVVVPMDNDAYDTTTLTTTIQQIFSTLVPHNGSLKGNNRKGGEGGGEGQGGRARRATAFEKNEGDVGNRRTTPEHAWPPASDGDTPQIGKSTHLAHRRNETRRDRR